MNIDAQKIPLFENLAQFEYCGMEYDFHNNYDCIQIQLLNNELILLFKHLSNMNTIEMRFFDVEIKTMKFIYIEKLPEGSLTIDNLYRGRFENNNNLYEFSDDGNSYFYLEFYEDKNIEFLCKKISINRVNTNIQ